MGKFDITGHEGLYDVVLADPAWKYYGSTTKHGAAAKEYKESMTFEEIAAIPMKSLLRDPKKGAFFVWATCPLLPLAIKAGEAWGLHYRGIAFNWVKTRKDGKPLGAMGVPPTGTKPVTELCLLFTTMKKGRPFPLLSAKVRQLIEEEEFIEEAMGEPIYHPRGLHSEKPAVTRDRIVDLYGDRPRIELFSRHVIPGWARIGNELVTDK